MKNILVHTPFTPYWIIRRFLNGSNKVLDVGCGDGAVMSKINYDKKFDVYGVDLYKPYLEKAKKGGVYKKLILSDLRKLKFQNKSFDAVLASQVIEHLSKKDSLKLISKLEKIAKHKVILSTPNGYVKFDPFEAADGNKLQIHKSGWEIKEMESMGYKVCGQANRIIYWPSSGLLYRYRRLKYIFVLISYLLSPISYFWPHTSSCIIALKEQ